jgi:cobalt-zinc-cadmium efflux system protein
MAADTLVSIGVVISGIIITYTGWNIIDPIVSLLIAIVILISTWHLLSESVKLSLDGTPQGINLDEIKAIMKNCAHVVDVHHIHIWAMSTTENALTAHIVLDDINQIEKAKEEIKKKLKENGIVHSTLEMETQISACKDMACEEAN